MTDLPVIISNSDVERLRALRASGMKWRAIQDENDKFSRVPLQSLWKMWKDGEVLKKYRPKDNRKRYRINVDEETHTRIQQAAAREGVTVAEWVREKVREQS